MATLLMKRPKSIVKRMAEDKKKVIEYLQSGDESKKPDGIKFVKPFSLSTK
jgi:hypothetical protein